MLNYAVSPAIHLFNPSESSISIEPASSTSLYIVKMNGAKERMSVGFKIPWGLFFLIATVGLIFVDAAKKHYLWLFLMHLWGGIAAFIFVFLGFRGLPASLGIVDFLIQYFIPVASLILVVLVMKNGVLNLSE